VTLTDDPRLLARYDGSAGRWRITQGTYRVAQGKSAEDLVLTADALGRAAIRKLMVVATDVKVRSSQPNLRWRYKIVAAGKKTMEYESD
jgi:hypothetical protein